MKINEIHTSKGKQRFPFYFDTIEEAKAFNEEYRRLTAETKKPQSPYIMSFQEHLEKLDLIR